MVLKFFDVVLKFKLPSAQFLNFPRNSTSVLIRPVLIIGDCMYITRVDDNNFTACVMKFCLPNHTKVNRENTGKLTPFDKANIF